MTEARREKKRNRLKGLQSLTCGAVGLLVAFDIINMRAPLYCLGLASDGVGDVFHAVTRLVRHGLPDVLDQFERNAITVSDALYLALTAVLIGAGFVFLRNTLRALAKAHPVRWVPLPRFGLHRAILTVLALGGGLALVWQYGDLPWLVGQFVRSLWLAAKGAYENRDAIWQAIQAIHENKETIAQVVKGIVGAIATYVTLEVARVTADLCCRSSILRRPLCCQSLGMAMPVTNTCVRGFRTSSPRDAKSIGCTAPAVPLPGRSSVSPICLSPSSTWPLGSLDTGAYSFCLAEAQSDPHNRAGGRPYEPLSDSLFAHRNTIHAHSSTRGSGYRRWCYRGRGHGRRI